MVLLLHTGVFSVLLTTPPIPPSIYDVHDVQFPMSLEQSYVAVADGTPHPTRHEMPNLPRATVIAPQDTSYTDNIGKVHIPASVPFDGRAGDMRDKGGGLGDRGGDEPAHLSTPNRP